MGVESHFELFCWVKNKDSPFHPSDEKQKLNHFANAFLYMSWLVSLIFVFWFYYAKFLQSAAGVFVI